ncbi:hypothetical protein NYY86_27100, partial [Acinetobacter baumannii]|nr:hypothetical protein [Acinetobacter baumannii]
FRFKVEEFPFLLLSLEVFDLKKELPRGATFCFPCLRFDCFAARLYELCEFAEPLEFVNILYSK